MSATASVAAPPPTREPRPSPGEWWELAVVAVLTVAGSSLLAAVVPQQQDLGGQVFWVGLGVTTYETVHPSPLRRVRM